jgi:hypothetical protein
VRVGFQNSAAGIEWFNAACSYSLAEAQALLVLSGSMSGLEGLHNCPRDAATVGDLVADLLGPRPGRGGLLHLRFAVVKDR